MFISELTVPEGVKTIGEIAFFGCGELKTVKFPKSLTAVAEGAFPESDHTGVEPDIADIYYNGTEADWQKVAIGEYNEALLKEANGERDNFPKLKSDIYAGDEHFKKGEYENAIDSYNRALENPSKFKDKILFKLLNKKATAFLSFSMTRFTNAKSSLISFSLNFVLAIMFFSHFRRNV